MATPHPYLTVQPRLQAARLAEHAVGALIDEAMLTPKPGLVDLRGRGAHGDLSWALMCDSACALRPAFEQMALAGAAGTDDVLLRRRIGALGRAAETAMLAASGGVNTHRGAIWALGLLVTAAACAPAAGADVIAARAGGLARIPDPGAPAQTGHKGETACRAHGVGGAKGQARAGFPHITRHALPMLARARAAGVPEHHARVDALLAIMASLDDTCILARGGVHALKTTQRGARAVLDAGGSAAPAGRTALAALEHRLRALHVSPGGAADLLAGALLLDRLAHTTTIMETS